MARTVGAIGWKTKQKYLHDKFPDQGWMDETDKKVINEHYQSIKSQEAAKKDALDELTKQAEELKMGY